MLALPTLLFSGPAWSQLVLEPSRPFHERLTDRVPVSGHTLVGLVMTQDSGPPKGVGLVPDHVGVSGRLAAERSPLCVRATSQDGHYWAENTYTTGPEVSIISRAALGWPSLHSDTLARMSLETVAVLARSGSCADRAQLVPVLLGSGSDGSTLQALVNTRGGAVTAALRDPESLRTLRRARCMQSEGDSGVAFDARCALGPTANLPRTVLLRLEQVSRDGLQNEVLESVTVRLGE